MCLPPPLSLCRVAHPWDIGTRSQCTSGVDLGLTPPLGALVACSPRSSFRFPLAVFFHEPAASNCAALAERARALPLPILLLPARGRPDLNTKNAISNRRVRVLRRLALLVLFFARTLH